jgi:hypothetical protein
MLDPRTGRTFRMFECECGGEDVKSVQARVNVTETGRGGVGLSS